MADTGITIDNLKTQLAEVQAALHACLVTGQSYNRPGFQIQRVQFEALTKREQYLIRQIARMSDGVVSASQVGPNNGQSYDNDYTWTHG